MVLKDGLDLLWWVSFQSVFHNSIAQMVGLTTYLNHYKMLEFSMRFPG